MKINKKYVCWGIVIIVLILALNLILPVFKPGILMNVDNPFHYSKLWCMYETGQIAAPSSWCPYAMAGAPLYQGYAPLGGQLVIVLAKIFSLEFSYKLILSLTYLLLPFTAFFILYSLKRRLSAAFVLAFLLFDQGGWDAGGFNQIFLVGQWANAMGLGFYIIATYMAYRFFENPSNKNLVLAAIFASLTMLGHGMHFVFYAITLIFLLIYFRKSFVKNWKKLALLPILVTVLCGMWLLPYFAKQEFFPGVPSGPLNFNQAQWDYFIFYFFTPINSALLLIGAVGLVIFLFKRRSFLNFFAYLGLSIPVIYLFSALFPSLYSMIPFTSYIYLPRLTGELRAILFIFAAIALFSIPSIKISKRIIPLRVPFILISIYIIYVCFSVVAPTVNAVQLSSSPAFLEQEKLYAVMKGEGGILAQDTLYFFGNFPQTLGHSFAIAPIFTKQPLFGGNPGFIFSKNKYHHSEKDNLFSKKINEFKQSELEDLTENLNIEFVVGHSEAFKDAFSFLPKVIDLGPWSIFHTNKTPSWIMVNGGRIINSSINHFDVASRVTMEKDGFFTFKKSNYANWKAFVDENNTPINTNEYGLMKIKVPEGEHSISFKYRLLLVDYIGWILSIVGIVGLIYLWRKK